MMKVFGRTEELELLRQRLRSRQSTLVHGPSGVGKTLLLGQVEREFSYVLYCGSPTSSQAMFRELAGLLAARKNPVVQHVGKGRRDALLEKSAVALKGIATDALRAGQYMVVLDHLLRPSQALAAAVREIMYLCSTPVLAITRSAHMEDAGYIAPMLPDRKERLAIHNFEPHTARLFVEEVRSQHRLHAANMESILESIVKHSGGNPGTIIRLLQMSAQSKYRSDDYVKWSPLYIDFQLERAAANAL